MLEISCKRIVNGKAKGSVLLLQQPINFLGMTNTKTGEITTINDEQKTHQLKGKILVFPNSIGSSVGAYTIFALKCNNNSPRAMICTNKVDITTASGCAISNIPLALIDENNYEILIGIIGGSSVQRSEIEISVDTEREIVKVDLNKSL